MASCFYYGRLSSVQFDRWQAPINGLHIDQCLVEKTAMQTVIIIINAIQDKLKYLLVMYIP